MESFRILGDEKRRVAERLGKHVLPVSSGATDRAVSTMCFQEVSSLEVAPDCILQVLAICHVPDPDHFHRQLSCQFLDELLGGH